MLSLKVFGVINPNRKDNKRTGDFGFYLMANNNRSIIEGNASIPGIIPYLSPGKNSLKKK
jgi:hypothetical protein